MAQGVLIEGVIDGIFNTQVAVMAKQLLDASALRHEALSANIANAETPGYKRLDISTDFQTQFNAAVKQQNVQYLQAVMPTVSEDPTAAAVRPDGNNVSIDKELMEVSRNSEEYQFLTQFLSGNLQQIKQVITAQPGG